MCYTPSWALHDHTPTPNPTYMGHLFIPSCISFRKGCRNLFKLLFSKHISLWKPLQRCWGVFCPLSSDRITEDFSRRRNEFTLFKNKEKKKKKEMKTRKKMWSTSVIQVSALATSDTISLSSPAALQWMMCLIRYIFAPTSIFLLHYQFWAYVDLKKKKKSKKIKSSDTF